MKTINRGGLLCAAALLFGCGFPPVPPTGTETPSQPDSTPVPNTPAPTPTLGSTPTAPSDTPAPTTPPDETQPPAQTPTPVKPNANKAVGGLLEASNDVCSDGLDNDDDGYVDCGDYSCSKTTSVTVCGTNVDAESTNAACSDGKDNNGNGYVDCADYSCSENGNVTVCDRDEDGFTPGQGDCLDDAKVLITTAVNPDVPEMCGDGFDNDCDGLVEESNCIDLYQGRLYVEKIYDGDTVELTGLGRSRLLGIDTPETNSDEPECYGPEATNFTVDRLYHKSVDVYFDPLGYESNFRDIYDRPLVHIYTVDGTYHNAQLVSGGYACAYRAEFALCLKSYDLQGLEDEAKGDLVGLWGECGEEVCF